MNLSQSIFPKVHLGQLCNIQIGKTPSRANPSYWGDGSTWLSIADMNNELIAIKSKEEITEKAVKDSGIRVIKKGTLILSFKLSIGKVSITGKDLYTNEAIAGLSIIDNSNVYQKYLYYVLKEFDLSGTSDKAVKGLTLNKSKLYNLDIPLPRLAVQQRIATILDHADSIPRSNKQILEKYNELARSVFYEMFGDPYTNPKHWKIFRIKDVASSEKNAIKAGPFGSSLKKELYVSKGYKIYGQEQVIKDDFNFGNYYINDELYNRLESCKIKEGDILISLVGSYGLISIVPKFFEPGIINPRLMKISLDHKVANPIFFKFLLQSKGIRTKIENSTHGGTMEIVNVGIMKNIEVPIPPLELQVKFIEILNGITNQKSLTQKSLEKSEELFQSLLQRTFIGEL